MHNRALHDSLAAFVEEAAWQLAEEVSGGAEIPFELDATPTRSSPLYCYKPLTGRFIAQRIGMLARLPSYPAAASGLAQLPDLPAYLRHRGRRVPAGDARAMPDCALQAFLGAVWGDATDFVFEAERFRAAYGELEEVAYGGCELSVVLAQVEGLVIESDEVPLGEGLALVRGTTLADAPSGLSDDPHATVAVLALESSRGEGPRARARRAPAAPPADRAAPVGRRRARARPDRLGAHRRQRLDGRPARHRPAPARRRLPAQCRRGGPAARVLRPRLAAHAALRRAGLGAAPLRARVRARQRDRGADGLAADGQGAVRRRRPHRLRRRRRADRRDLRRGA